MKKLSQEEIKSNIPGFFHTVEITDSTDSTNTRLKQKAGSLEEGYVLISRGQTAGRGRNGKSFCCEKDKGLYLSFLLKPDISFDKIQAVTACTAAAAVTGIKNATGIDCGIKWVNDIYAEGRKVAGILCETALKPGTAELEYLVVGIGINIYKMELPQEIADTAATLSDFSERPLCINTITSEFLTQFYNMYSSFESRGFMEIYRKNFILAGQAVTVISPDGEYTATVLDTDDNGGLIINRNGNIQTLYSAEISIRKNDRA